MAKSSSSSNYGYGDNFGLGNGGTSQFNANSVGKIETSPKTVAPGVPTQSSSAPSTGKPTTSATTPTGNPKTTAGKDTGSGSSPAAPPPRIKQIKDIKTTLLSPALTSNFQCWFYPTPSVVNWINSAGRLFNYDANMQEFISINCSEASLPGSTLMTNEIADDYHGVTERHAYRRQYDDRADFTFYVDQGSRNSHNTIWMFEQWISYIVDEQYNSDTRPSVYSKSHFYRMKFPTDYQSTIYIQKFERDYKGTFLEYQFLQAYPISINSMPVSYDSSQLLKCTVSFAYTRYVVRRKGYASSSGSNDIDGSPKTAPGVPDPATKTETQVQTKQESDAINRSFGGTEYYNNSGNNSQNSTNTADFFGVA